MLAGTRTRYIRAFAVSLVRLPDSETWLDSVPPETKRCEVDISLVITVLTLLLLQVEQSSDDSTENDGRGLVTPSNGSTGIVLLRS